MQCIEGAERPAGADDLYWNSVSRFRAWLACWALALCASAAASAQPDGSPTEAMIRQGLIALQARDLPKAQEILERVIQQSPDEARAWIGLAQVYVTLNLHAQAARHAAEAARRGEDDPLIQHALAMFYSDYGETAEAAQWEERFARAREDPEAFLRTVSLYLQAGMPLRATEVGKAALELGESAALHNALGKAYAMSDRPAEGLRHLRQAVESEPYEESLHYDLGYFFLRRQDFEAARQAFLVGRRFFDKSVAIEIGLGIAAYGQRRFDEAVERFLRAAELAPGMEQPHAFLGRLLQHAGKRIDDVEGRLRIFHEEHSETHFGPFLYGQVQLARLGPRPDPGAMAGIEALLRESIKRKDDFWEAHYELGVLLDKRRDFESARDHLERAASLNPDSSKPHYRLARVYQRLGKSREAKRERELHRQIAERERQAMRAGGLPSDLTRAIGSQRR